MQIQEKNAAGQNFDPDLLIALHKELLNVRLTEETLAERYREQEMRTPAHFGTGQEAVAVGVCQALRKDDVAFSHHRCHNHYLAKGGSVYELAAELYGRVDGCSRGRGAPARSRTPCRARTRRHASPGARHRRGTRVPNGWGRSGFGDLLRRGRLG